MRNLIVIPIFKKGARSDYANDGHISRLQIAPKLLASVIPRGLHKL